jgi:exodeoxyribonuclease VII small subunit
MSDSAPSIESFESEFERLTAIVDRLETGNVALGDMLKLYEEGMGLASNLRTVLAEAELKVEKLAAMHEESLASEPRGERESVQIEDEDDEDEDDELLF